MTSGTVTLYRGGQFVGANRQPGLVDGSCTAKCSETTWPPLSPWLVLSRSSLGSVVEASTDAFGTAVAAKGEQRIDSPAGLDAFGSALTTGRLLENAMMGDALVIGAPQSLNAVGTRSGRAYVYGREGDSGSCEVFPFTVVNGVTVNERYGHALLVTDVDRDGDQDLVVGAPESGVGRVHMVASNGWTLTRPVTTGVGRGGLSHEQHRGRGVRLRGGRKRDTHAQGAVSAHRLAVLAVSWVRGRGRFTLPASSDFNSGTPAPGYGSCAASCRRPAA